MDTTLIPSEKKSILYPDGYQGKYAAFEVGYMGDKAGINFQFVKAVNSNGVQHLKDRQINYTVVTTSDSFNIDSLRQKLKSNLSEEDRAVLTDGQELLEDFISRNGQTNPACAEDFELAPA